jgi:hypothetical protein
VKIIPMVKSVVTVSSVSSSYMGGKPMSAPGEFKPGTCTQGFTPVFNFSGKPNDYFNRKQSPTSGGGKKVY